MKLKSELRILAIILATVVLSPFLLGVDSCNGIAYGQAAVNQPGQGTSTPLSAPPADLGAVWNDVTRTISAAQWTQMGLQGNLGKLVANRPLSDADRKDIGDMINQANTTISQWGSKKSDWMSRIATMQSQINSSTMSSNDKISSRSMITEINALIERGDRVIAGMQNSLDLAKKYM